MRKTAAISLLLISGCMVGPNYEEPCPDFCPHFTEEENSGGKEVNLNEWWMQFNDPVLNEIIDEAVANNYDLRIAAARIAEVRANYEFASANLWPEIDVQSTVIRERISQNLFDSRFLGPTVQNYYQIGFDASWELDFFGRLRRLKEAAYFDLESSWESLRNVYITLLAEVSRNYTVYRSLQQRVCLTLEQIRIDKELLNLSQVRFRAGLRSDIEPLQVAAELDALQATLPPLESDLKQTLYSLAILLGKQPEQIPENWQEPQPIPQAKGKIPVGLPSDLLRRRPDIRQAERKIAAANSRVGAAIAELFPTFALTGSFGLESVNFNKLFDSNSMSWTVGPTAFWPFIDFGRIRSRIDYQKSSQREALMAYEQTVLQALEEVESALIAYTKEEERLRRITERVESLKESRDLFCARFQAGLSSYTEVLDAEQQVLLAEQSRITSEQSLSGNLMAIYKSLGGDWSCCSTP